MARRFYRGALLKTGPCEDAAAMQIDWVHFTPWSAATGGALIGVASAIMILGVGRVAGISGIVSGLLSPRVTDAAWRIAFIAGLLCAPAVLSLWRAPEAPVFSTSWGVLALAGALVGFGSRLGSGCTSGHGVCGLSRLSPRSLAATATFMTAGFATVFVVRHLLG
jgi:uncharacterized protein